MVSSGRSILGDRELASTVGVGIIGVLAVTRVGKVKHRKRLAESTRTAGNVLTGLEGLVRLAGPKDGHLGTLGGDEMSIRLPGHGECLAWVGLGKGQVGREVVSPVLVEEEGILGSGLADWGGVVATGDEVGVDSIDVNVGAGREVCGIACTFARGEGLDAVDPGVGFSQGRGREEGCAQEEGC